MIDTLHMRLAAIPFDASLRGLPGIGIVAATIAAEAAEVEIVESPRAYRCPGCSLPMPADMLIRFRGGWECSGCIEGRYFRGEATRAELWREAGQEDVPGGSEYWTRTARRARRYLISQGIDV